MKVFEEFEIVGLCPNDTDEASPHLIYIMVDLKGGQNWNQTHDFDTQMICFFSSFFRIWMWSQAASHVAGKLPCAALTEDKSLRMGGLQWKDAWSRSEKNSCATEDTKSATRPAASKKQTNKPTQSKKRETEDNRCVWMTNWDILK